jgi:hypothetical protein
MYTPVYNFNMLENSLGVIKIPGRIWEMGLHRKTWFGVFLLLNKDEKHQLMPTAMTFYESITVPVAQTPRAVVIELLKDAIQNTKIALSEIPPNLPEFVCQRLLYKDVIIHSEIYLEELMYAEAAEREKIVAAKKIQRAFVEAITRPEHPFCIRRLMREFHELREYSEF